MGALTREKKEETVTKLKSKLESSTVVLGLSYNQFTVKTISRFRRELPEGTELVVCKNTLMNLAASEVEGWSALSEHCKGPNAWLFIGEDIPGSIKPYRKLQKSLKKGGIETEFSGGCLEGQSLQLSDIDKLEKLPTKLELIAQIASMINQPVRKIAVGVRQVPSKIAYGIKAVSEKEE